MYIFLRSRFKIETNYPNFTIAESKIGIWVIIKNMSKGITLA